MASPIISLNISTIPEVPGSPEVHLVSEALNVYSAGLIDHMLDCHNRQDYESAAAFKKDIETIGELQGQIVRLLSDAVDEYHLSREREYDWGADRERRRDKYTSEYIKAHGLSIGRKGGSNQ